MIGGIGSIDLALLVVAADDGWMPQTEEHLQILIYLGVKRALIAVTKSDLGKIDHVAAQTRHQLRDTAFTTAHIIPTSVRTGEGIDNLKRALALELATLPPQRDIGKARLFVDRAFTLRGIGTVVTGTLTGGKLRRGQNVIVQPQNVPARIRSIQSHGRDLEFAGPGMRTALNLPDVELGTGTAAIKRGDVITIADLVAPSATFNVLLEKSPRPGRGDPAARPLKNGSSVHIHHGTSRFHAKIALLEEHAIEPGKQAIAQLRLQSPIFAFLGDRFVLRDASEQHTIAGGVVLNPDGDREKFRDTARRKLFAARSLALDDVDVCLRSEIALSGFAQRDMLLRKSRFSAVEIAEALLRLQRRNEIIVSEDIVADAETWQALCARATHLIDDAHRRNPERAGLDLSDLRATLRDHPPDLFEALISDLCRKDFRRKDSVIARIFHRPTLPLHLELAAKKIREALAEKSSDPLARKEIVRDRHLQSALRFLIQQGEIIEAGPDLILLREVAEQMQSVVVAFISRNGPATVSQLRQKLGTSRRVLVPFLEHLDRRGITEREGDRRKLRNQENIYSTADLLQ
jgi:selenocysteine-specific elongation factor